MVLEAPRTTVQARPPVGVEVTAVIEQLLAFDMSAWEVHDSEYPIQIMLPPELDNNQASEKIMALINPIVDAFHVIFPIGRDKYGEETLQV